MDFSEYSPQDYRKALRKLDQELDAIREMKRNLDKERQTLQTLLYIAYPDEAKRDGYMNATGAIAARLAHAKQPKREAKQSKTLQALIAEHIERGARTFYPFAA